MLVVGDRISPEIDVAFASNPFDPNPSWHAETERFQAFSSRRGRNNELGKIEAGEFTATLANMDRKIDPRNVEAGPPYFLVSHQRNVTARQRSGNVATLSVGSHSFVVGDRVIVFNVASDFDGEVIISAVGATTISYFSPGPNLSLIPSGGKAVRGRTQVLPMRRCRIHVRFGDPVAVVARHRNANIATLTTATPHNMTAGMSITVSGVGSGFDGDFFIVTAVTATTVSFSNPGPNHPASSSGGEIVQDYPRITGFVESWTQVWEEKAFSQVELVGSDAFKTQRMRHVGIPFQEQLLSFFESGAPGAYWRLDEKSGTSFIDSSGNGHTGTHAAVTVGRPPVIREGHAAEYTFDVTTRFSSVPASAAFNLPVNFTLLVSCRLKAGFSPSSFHRLLRYPDFVASPNTSFEFYISDTGRFTFEFYVGLARSRVASTTVAAANTNYHIAVVKRGSTAQMWINGILEKQVAVAGAPPNALTGPLMIGSASSTGLSTFHGFIDEVAILPNQVLAKDEIEELHTAAQQVRVIPVGRSGDALATLLDSFGWPGTGRGSPQDPHRNIDLGNTVIASHVPADATFLEAAQKIADTELGQFFIDRKGAATFHERQRRMVTKAPKAVFGDSEDELGYVSISPEYGEGELYTQAVVTRVGSEREFVAENRAAAQTFGGRTLDGFSDLLLTSNAEAQQLANYLVARYDEPQQRIIEVAINLRSAPNRLVPIVLGLEIGDVIQIRRRPPGGGSPIDQVSFIEAIADDAAAADGSYIVTLSLTPADPQSFMILNDSVFGVLSSPNARLGF